ncbi:MAG TPA: class II fructose-bisphosphate aldolase [bacterium]|nr:class II fructose-bisphosphate aldolase [bacterium]
MKPLNIFKYFKKAQKEKWAIGQFNFSTIEQAKGIIEAANKLRSPVILGTSEGESAFIGIPQAVALIKIWQTKNNFPVFLNLDHGKSFEYTKRAIDNGYDSVHFDGSRLYLKENIKITKKITEYAHKRNLLVEGEVGIISGLSKILNRMPKISNKDLTNPEDAYNFIKKTGVDSLAINIGTFHGVNASGKNPHINFQRLEEIKKKVKNKFLVLHGGSGVSNKDIKKAIKLGIVKININTELRIAYTNTLRNVFKDSPKEITPYKYMPKAIDAVQKVIEEKMKLLGSVNKI